MSDPNNIFGNWVGDVIDYLANSFIATNGEFILDQGGSFDNWCDKLFFFGKTPEQAAAIIQRSYKLYIKHD